MSKSNRNNIMADTVLIKLFEDYKNEEEHKSQLKEMLEFRKEITNGNGMLLHLRESLQGNIFNRPFQYILIRHLSRSDITLSDLKNDQDPMSDFFVTLQKVERRADHDIREKSDNEKLVKLEPKEKRYAILAFKVLDDDNTSKLDRTWKDWTGTGELLKTLSKTYKINSVSCLKGVNVVPDIFKYVVLIEFATGQNVKNRNDMYALDCLQKFRIKRMSGYVALYTIFDAEDIYKKKDMQEEF